MNLGGLFTLDQVSVLEVVATFLLQSSTVSEGVTDELHCNSIVT